MLRKTSFHPNRPLEGYVLMDLEIQSSALAKHNLSKKRMFFPRCEHVFAHKKRSNLLPNSTNTTLNPQPSSQKIKKQKTHRDFKPTQGTVALLTLGKVHILAPVAHSFRRNPPCCPGDLQVKALRSPLEPLQSVFEWRTALSSSWFAILPFVDQQSSDNFPIDLNCWVLPKHCKHRSLWRFPSLKKAHVLLTHFVNQDFLAP